VPRSDEIEEFLDQYPPRVAEQVQELRAVVQRAVPTAIERLRPGWRLIGYDLPARGHSTYFAWVWPQVEHVHVGWEVGTLMDDPRGMLQGAHLKLKKVRYLTFEPGDEIDADLVAHFTRHAAEIAAMSRGERQLRALSKAS
jgi:hypothetical protein